VFSIDKHAEINYSNYIKHFCHEVSVDDGPNNVKALMRQDDDEVV